MGVDRAGAGDGGAVSGRGSPTLFVGIDSRGAKIAGRHRLVRVCASSGIGRVLELSDPEGLDSLEVFEWLGRVHEAWPARRLVLFAGRYDVTQWLSGVPRRTLETLWQRGEATWHRHMSVTPPNRVALHMIDGRSFGVWLPGWESRVRVTDVHGFFQSTLAEALEAWGEPVPRSELELAEWCGALARLMGRVSVRASALEMKPASWIGAGSFAGALLRRHGMRARIANPRRPLGIERAILTAYYGGRVDMLAQGEADRVVALDIRSAYPSELAGAPSMVGSWRTAKPGELAPGVFGVWRCRFASPPLRALSPLPVRHPARVVWPARGSGWWHTSEVLAAIDTGAEVEVLEGFRFTPHRGEPLEPWSWVREVYWLREGLRERGDPAERLVKLALNSLYGKLAQSRGAATYQCYALAGHVTAAIRARMLRAASLTPARVIGIHTDGMILEGRDLPHELKIGRHLGAWEAHAGERFLIVQPGVYTYSLPGEEELEEPEEVARTRGVKAEALSWARVEEAWRARGVAGAVSVRQEMHHGLGTCSRRGRYGTLGQWVTETREVSFAAGSRFPSHAWRGGLQPMFPILNGGDAVPYEPGELDADELLRTEQP